MLLTGIEGYPAGVGTHLPAVNLSISDISEKIFDTIYGIRYEVHWAGETNQPVREGYHGMVVVIGRVLWTRRF